MLLGRQTLALGSELSQTAANAETSVAWLDDVVDIAILSSLIRIGKLLGILLFLLCQECLHVLAGFLLCLGFLATEHCNGTAGTHYGNLRRWPCEVQVGTQLLATHHDVATTIALTQCDSNLWHGSLAVSVEQLCTMKDDSIVLLTCTWQESWYVNERYDRNIEGIAETNEASCLTAGIHIEYASVC